MHTRAELIFRKMKFSRCIRRKALTLFRPTGFPKTRYAACGRPLGALQVRMRDTCDPLTFNGSAPSQRRGAARLSLAAA
jgi:hypothetical protein